MTQLLFEGGPGSGPRKGGGKLLGTVTSHGRGRTASVGAAHSWNIIQKRNERPNRAGLLKKLLSKKTLSLVAVGAASVASNTVANLIAGGGLSQVMSMFTSDRSAFTGTPQQAKNILRLLEGGKPSQGTDKDKRLKRNQYNK